MTDSIVTGFRSLRPRSGSAVESDSTRANGRLIVTEYRSRVRSVRVPGLWLVTCGFEAVD